MLDDAIAAFLDHIRPERAFDQPFMALLRAEGFERVRLTHGTTEFGKDVIAQRDGQQWAWQSKVGNVAQNFRDMAGQLDELRLSNVSHPDFDLTLPRRAVLVTTGHLKGNGVMSMREYNDRAAQRDEVLLEHWDRDILIGKLASSPDAVLRGSLDGQLLSLLGAIDERAGTMDAVHDFSSRWESWEPQRLAGLGVLECALLCDRLHAQDRLDLACHTALCAVRAAMAATAAGDGEQLGVVGAEALFEQYARLLWTECDERLLRDAALVAYSGPSAWVTYPLRCLRLAEHVALLALYVVNDEPELAAEIADWLARFVRAQPGVMRPIGDRYAVSLVPVALVLARGGDRPTADHVIRRAAVWMGDRYEPDQLGLSGHDASPREEVERILGGPFELVGLDRRRASNLAVVLLDLCALLELPDLYALVYNDVRAVSLFPATLVPGTGVDRYMRSGRSNRWDHNPDYAENLGNGPVAPHLDIDGECPTTAEAWRLLAVSSALRDRHFVEAIAALATKRGTDGV